MIDHGSIGWAAIARESRGASAGHRLDIAVRRYFSDAVVVGVGARKSHVVYRDRVINVRARRIN